MGYSSEETIRLMNAVMTKMAELNYPVVFKGALITRLLTEDKIDTIRITRDIDMDWQKLDTTEEQIGEYVLHALNELGVHGLDVTTKRRSSKSTTANLRFHRGSQMIFSIDVGIKTNNEYSYYTTPHGITIRGQSLNKIIVDKTSAVSTKLVFRRAKDVYDIYILSKSFNFSTEDLRVLITKVKPKYGDFSDLIRGRNEYTTLEHAYSKMSGIHNKPPYEEMINHVRRFIRVFNKEDLKRDLEWAMTPNGFIDWV